MGLDWGRLHRADLERVDLGLVKLDGGMLVLSGHATEFVGRLYLF
ncbi:hypothetical protein RSSM_06597 [Rhodopirellula sallentina SM41]|uniref:Uncharacterized protein n=1 Tax=Rhodopirellula sallentina SM41 TaxID=1263870 RepID=M5TSD5_9BACT|nr:hypothetical protein RSSM_06597 [Rhodopirellula sallentina SM41]